MQTTTLWTRSVFSTTRTVGLCSSSKPSLGQHARRIFHQPGLEIRIRPGAGDEPRAVRRRQAVHVLDPALDGFGGEDAFLHQQFAERALQRFVIARRVVGSVGVAVGVGVAHASSSSGWSQCS